MDASASHCQEKYGKERNQHWQGDLWEEYGDSGHVWEDKLEEEEWVMEDEYEMEEDNASLTVILCF